MTSVCLDVVSRIPQKLHRAKTANDDWSVVDVYKGMSRKTLSGCWSLNELNAEEFKFSVFLDDLEKYAPMTAERIRKYLPPLH